MLASLTSASPGISNRHRHVEPAVGAAPLIDAWGRCHTYLRLSVTPACNLNCIYCRPRHAVRSPHLELLAVPEMIRLVKVFAQAGITKVRLTGGEPLLHPRILDLIADLKAIDGLQTLGLTTNSVLLGRSARALKQAGISALNVSLDTLKPDRFERITGQPVFFKVRESIDQALQAGFASLKLNVVVIGGVNDDEVLDFVEFTRHRPIQVRFIEHMPFTANSWRPASLVSGRVLCEQILRRYPLVPAPEDTAPSGTARVFQVEGFAGTIGFIDALTNRFCSQCNRLRLLADGSLKTCLFRRPEVNLRPALRAGASDGRLTQMIRAAVSGKLPQHPSLDELVRQPQSMFNIGG